MTIEKMECIIYTQDIEILLTNRILNCRIVKIICVSGRMGDLSHYRQFAISEKAY